ncbi:MAG TPA: 3-carboxy-cis,cis-muconate cycloisomerase [Chloroflexota bacterium]|nr:3-carboxy-cis,cis-muconate cycloisomerase [Chloroflexota bacterium]
MYSTPRMSETFSREAHVREMLAFEAALARAEARAGIIPPAAAAAIAAACRADLFDVATLDREAAVAGTLAIPLVRRLTERVAGEAGQFVHWGATSQDAIDTALVLQLRGGLDLLTGGLLDVGSACASLAERYRRTPMAGRTLLQQALPITFGLKAARWLALATRQVRRLRELRGRVLVVQFGGAAGTLASLGQEGMRVTELLAGELGLAVPTLPWHAERDRIAEVATALGVVAGAMAKIASDVALLAQTEVGEVSPVAVTGKGGSSALPQKRNPVDATMALAAARLAIGVVPVVLGAMVQEHERAVGGWQAEWEALPNLFRYTSHAIERVHQAVQGLVVDPARLRANLDLGGGTIMAEALTMALAPRFGRVAAFHLVRAACERATALGVSLRQAALDDDQIRAALPSDAVDQVFDPAAYLGSTDSFVDRALEDWRGLA